jgi:hypothetical protein
MNAHIHPALRIDNADLHAIIAAANKLLAKPERESLAHLALLCAVEKIDGQGALDERIAELESDLGVGDADEPQCLVCSTDCNGACDYALTFVERIAPGRIAA